MYNLNKQVYSEKIVRVVTYTDGSIEFHEVTEPSKEAVEQAKEVSSLLNNCSERIKQILMVVMKMQDTRGKISEILGDRDVYYRRVYALSVKRVADELNIQVNTVFDKCQRQMGKTSQEIRSILGNYLEGQNNDLRDLLLANTGTHNTPADTIAINAIIPQKSSEVS